jgi:hypothetical protein
MQHPSPSTRVPRLRRLSIALAALAVGFALLIPSAASAASFGARVVFPKSNPVMNQRWNITIYAWKGHRELSGSTRYQFLLNGVPVTKTRKGITFHGGVGHDHLTFPGAAVGHTLTLRVLVTTSYGTLGFNHNVTTQK